MTDNKTMEQLSNELEKLKKHIAFQENFHKMNLNAAVEYGKKRDKEIEALKDLISEKLVDSIFEDN